jgi:hypothetical protein
MTQTLALAARWRVIASVRKYDLRYGQEFQRLFAGAPHTVFFDPIFRNVRHLNIPPLDDDELKQIASQSPQLADLVEAASGALRELLRVPFNLSLAASLLEGGITVAELTPVRTQLELLDRYWDARVRREDRLGDAREAVLRLAVEEMVRRRSLRAPRSAVASDPAASTHLHDILSANVLVEWQPPHAAKPDQSLLAFSHHVLYDYAVERLLLRGEPADLVSRLESSPDLALAIRPSLVLHFQHVWAQGPDRKAFWALVERIERSNQVPDIAKTIGPTVAKEMFRTLDDLSPVFGPLEASDEH